MSLDILSYPEWPEKNPWTRAVLASLTWRSPPSLRSCRAASVNTNGGGLSYCHPGAYGTFLIIEATRQLRNEGGDRQVKDANTALAHGNGGTLSSQVTVLLGNEAVV